MQGWSHQASKTGQLHWEANQRAQSSANPRRVRLKSTDKYHETIIQLNRFICALDRIVSLACFVLTASETTTADPSPEDRLPQSPPTESPIPLRRAASPGWNGPQEPPAPPELLANPNPADLAAPSVRELYSTLEASASTSAGEQSSSDRRALTATIQGVNLMNPDSRRFFTATVTAGLPASVKVSHKFTSWNEMTRITHFTMINQTPMSCL